MRCSGLWPFLLFFAASCVLVRSGHCYGSQQTTPFETIERRVVAFSPPVFISPDSSLCLGLVISSDRIAVTRECATVARQVMQSGSVTVNNVEGERVGVLPDLSVNPVLQIQTETLPAMQLPFVSDQQGQEGTIDEGGYPRFIPGQGFVEGLYFVFTGDDGSEWLPVGVSRVDDSGDDFFLTTTDSRLDEAGLERLPVGSPVVDEQGRILCLVDVGGSCQSIVLDPPIDNDGTCHLQIFDCDDPKWEYCSNGLGVGSCIRPTDGHNCTLAVTPDGGNNISQCWHRGGCGSVDCKCHPVSSNCSCIAWWGFCNLEAEAVTIPNGCITGGEPPKPRDHRCESKNPTTASPPSGNIDKTTLGLIIGVPLGAVVLTVTTIVVVAGVLYRVYFRRITYENIPS